MTLTLLLNDEIEPWKKTRIKIPEGANCYRFKSGKIRVFRSNPEERFHRIPKGAKEMGFYMERNSFNIEYGNPKFYDFKGNDLNIYNY